MRPLSAAYEGYHRPKLGAETLLDDTAHGLRNVAFTSTHEPCFLCTVVRTGFGCAGEVLWTRNGLRPLWGSCNGETHGPVDKGMLNSAMVQRAAGE
jgi:hypothetical protein